MSEEPKEPIRGWLILIAIWLWFAPFYNFYILVNGLIYFHLHNFWIYLETVDGFIRTILSIIILILFIKRKTAFIKVMIACQIYFFFLETVFLLEYIHLHRNLTIFIIGYLEIIVILLYMIRSKRVKWTFVR